MDVGNQDITSHVNFSALSHWGLKNGLEYSGFTDQGRFLLALGFGDYLEKTEESGKDHLNYKKKAFLIRTLLQDMGDKFKVLIQQKGVSKQPLSGLKLS
jgi:SAM-dependent MidA family methyltransferase